MFYVKMYDYFSPIISAQHITITISTADYLTICSLDSTVLKMQ